MLSRARFEVSSWSVVSKSSPIEVMKTTLLCSHATNLNSTSMTRPASPTFPTATVRRARPNGRQAANLVAKGRTSQNGWKSVGTIHVRGQSKTGSAKRLSLSSNDVERPLAGPMMLYEVRDFFVCLSIH
jgi:hypothetical protein